MALINVAAKEIHCKLVYYGPGLSGKTTNLKYIFSAVPTGARGDLLSIDTETERTLFFDFLPLDLGRVHGYQVRFHIYTVPGQVLYERTPGLPLSLTQLARCAHTNPYGDWASTHVYSVGYNFCIACP